MIFPAGNEHISIWKTHTAQAHTEHQTSTSDLQKENIFYIYIFDSLLGGQGSPSASGQHAWSLWKFLTR